MYTQVGSCPHCGAPIYTYMNWNAVTPPPNIYSCGCRLSTVRVVTLDRTPTNPYDEKYTDGNSPLQYSTYVCDPLSRLATHSIC